MFLVQRTQKIMTPRSYYSSSLSLIALEAMPLLVRMLQNLYEMSHETLATQNIFWSPI